MLSEANERITCKHLTEPDRCTNIYPNTRTGNFSGALGGSGNGWAAARIQLLPLQLLLFAADDVRQAKPKWRTQTQAHSCYKSCVASANSLAKRESVCVCVCVLQHLSWLVLASFVFIIFFVQLRKLLSVSLLLAPPLSLFTILQLLFFRARALSQHAHTHIHTRAHTDTDFVYACAFLYFIAYSPSACLLLLLKDRTLQNSAPH